MSGREKDAVVLRRLAKILQRLPRVAVDWRTGDFQEVEAELGDLLDVLELVGLPFVFPVGVVDSVVHSR